MRKMKHFMLNTFFLVTVFEIIVQIGCYAYTSVHSSNQYGVSVIPEMWIIHIFLLFLHFPHHGHREPGICYIRGFMKNDLIFNL